MNFLPQRFEKAQRRRAILMHSPMRQSEWPQQPAPHGALMVGAIAFARPTDATTYITAFRRRQAAQSMRRQQLKRANPNHIPLLLRRQRAHRQTHCENLIRPQRSVISLPRRVDHVEAESVFRTPEALKILLSFDA